MSGEDALKDPNAELLQVVLRFLRLNRT
jgi:hypothetical protein